MVAAEIPPWRCTVLDYAGHHIGCHTETEVGRCLGCGNDAGVALLNYDCMPPWTRDETEAVMRLDTALDPALRPS